MKAQPWPPPTLDQWMRETKANPKALWWIERLLPGDAITLVSGPAKTARKTLAVMEMVRCLTSAKDMPGMELAVREKCNVLFLEYEGPALPLVNFWDWMDNASGWSAELERVSWAHRYSHVRLTDPQWADRIIKHMADNKCRGLVVDTFTRSVMAPENDTIATQEAFNVLQRVADESDGGWVIYIHHLRKASDPWEEDIDLQVRGNSTFAGSYDHHLAFRPGSSADSIHLYTRSKVDQDRFFRWYWHIDKETEHISFRIEEFEVGSPPASGLVQDCIETIPDNQVRTLKQLGELWDVQRAVAKWLVEAMCGAGMMDPTARGYRKVG